MEPLCLPKRRFYLWVEGLSGLCAFEPHWSLEPQAYTLNTEAPPKSKTPGTLQKP